jgi:hypothetical protein
MTTSTRSSGQLSAGRDIVFRNPVTISSLDEKTQDHVIEQMRFALMEDHARIDLRPHATGQSTARAWKECIGRQSDVGSVMPEFG